MYFRLLLYILLPVTEMYCLLISSDVADRWEMMNVVCELASVLSLKHDVCWRVCLTCKHNKATKTCSNIYKLQQMNRVTKCLVQLIYKIQCFFIQFFSVETEAVHSVSIEQKQRKFKYSSYKQTNKNGTNLRLTP